MSSSIAHTAPLTGAAVHELSLARQLAAYGLEIRFEFLRMAREPLFGFISLMFPVVLYLLFGLGMHHDSAQPHAARYFLASYTVFGVMAPGLFGFGLSIAIERSQGLLTLRRAMPTPIAAYITAKMMMSVLFAAIVAVVLLAVAEAFGGVRLDVAEAVQLVAISTLGVAPFCALGLWVGAALPHQPALAILNLLYLGMGLLSGMLASPGSMPSIIANTAPVWPSYHLAQLTLQSVGAGGVGSSFTHVLVLAATTLVFFSLAARRLARAV